MPFIGTRHRTKDNKLMVTTKIYGPTPTFMFDPSDVLKEVKRIADGDDSPPAKRLATAIADQVANLIRYDKNAKWVDCEVLQDDGILFGDVSLLEDE